MSATEASVRRAGTGSLSSSGGHIFRKCLPWCVISPSASLLHRSLFDEPGTFDEDLPAGEDYDLWLRICATEPVAFVPEPQICKYGGHADQLSRQCLDPEPEPAAAL